MTTKRVLILVVAWSGLAVSACAQSAPAGTPITGVGSLPLLPRGNHLGMKVGFESYPPAVSTIVDEKWQEALSRGMRIGRIQLDWADLEPVANQYDTVALLERLQPMQADGLSSFVLIGTVDTLGTGRPADLLGTSFGDPAMIARYQALMDWVVPMVTDHGGYCISIGNEPMGYLGNQPSELQPMADFIAAIRDYVHSINPDMAVTMTLNGSPEVWAVPFDTLAAQCDVLCANHYGLDANTLLAKDPAMFASDLQNLLSHASGKNLILQELGMPSGWTHQPSLLGATEEMARQFLRNAVAVLKSEPRFRAAYWFTTMDWSQTLANVQRDELAAAGVPPSALVLVDEWLRTGGLCRYEQPGFADGSPRSTWDEFLLGLGPPRPLMGFTSFPYDVSQQAVDDTYSFIANNADLITFHLDNKVPWPEALAGNDQYHPNVIAEIDAMIANIPPGHSVYVSTTPQNTARAAALADYWAETDGLPLPPGWDTKTLDDPDVIQAFTNWCRYLIARYHPDFFAYGIESNGGFTGVTDPGYAPFIALAQQVYATLKAENPTLPIFLTVQTSSFAVVGQPFLDMTSGILAYSDYVAVSSYPYAISDPNTLITHGDPSEIPSDLLTRIANLAPSKPFAVGETGYIAETLDVPELGIFQEGRESWQAAYVQRLLSELKQLQAKFVVWFLPRDHDMMNERLLQLGVTLTPIYFIWRDTGMLSGNGNAREALCVWRQEMGLGSCAPVPTTSQWGLVSLSLLLLIGGSVLLRVGRAGS